MYKHKEYYTELLVTNCSFNEREENFIDIMGDLDKPLEILLKSEIRIDKLITGDREQTYIGFRFILREQDVCTASSR